MKSYFSIIFILSAYLIIALSCKKSSDQGVKNQVDPVDRIIGTYHGYMHVLDSVVHYSDFAHPTITDTTYSLAVTIHKGASDSFSVDGLSFLNWSYPGLANTTNIGYKSVNVYTSIFPSGESDSLLFIPGADSIYFSSHYYKPGGATTESKTEIFSGKKG